ncbi:MAG: hypothetical protein L0H29_09380 [Sinobacteraceae bacterium]|nr:hypothetical protein [Nevskiaceae bacterium]
MTCFFRGAALASVLVGAVALTPAMAAHAAGVSGPDVIHVVTVTPAAPYHFFGRLPETLRAPWNGISLGGIVDTRRYAEHSTTGDLDSEGGMIPGAVLGVAWQGQHWGAHLRAHYAAGGADYSGACQYASAGIVVPISGTTGNRMTGVGAGVDWAFSPLHKLAVRTGPSVSYERWNRDLPKSSSCGSYTEKYTRLVPSWNLGVARAIGPVVIQARLRYGLSISPSMKASLAGGHTFNLGDHVDYGFGLGVIWSINDQVSVYLTDRYEHFGFGASGLTPVGGGIAIGEPASTTNINRIGFGVRLQLW